ncbi:hypothetical protein [Rubinisphaera italica]|uniref:Uncharacterized protein n=1 Tax=Rubinisphaera italica TaxID=2527969 RepID=A0A5C5XGX7_9PLAN|nr:hypothetical protein [Rubinisphaera italica]TWT61395.1 hypothetical protein Pan54_21310 [Rubinisphaera italica]
MNTPASNQSQKTASPSRRAPFPNPQENLHPGQDLITYVKDYARQKPEAAALWCFGIGFVVGWKLKPW